MGATDSVVVEYDLRPAYYDDFHCLAGDCKLSCCKGWHIPFDRAAYMKLKKVRGSSELNGRMGYALHRLRSGSFSEKYFGEFRLNEADGECPLHCENGLCLLQLEKGPEILPEVCRIFPRMEMAYFSGYLERALAPSCEGVLQLLWNLPDGVDFRADPLPEPARVPFASQYCGTLVENFQEVRSKCIDILQDRRMPLAQRIMLLGMALKIFVDGETDMGRWMLRVQLLLEQAAADGVPLAVNREQSILMFLINCIHILNSLPAGDGYLARIRRELYDALDFEQENEGGAESLRGSISVESYLRARARYEERFAGREYFMENLMVSLYYQLKLPALDSMEQLWKGYVAFCNMYGLYRFLAVMSCREGASGDRDELFRLIASGSRDMLHNKTFNEAVLDSLYQHESATLAHMAILFSS